MRIVPVRIALADTTVSAVNEELAALVPGDAAPGIDSLPLGLVDRTRPAAPGPSDSPTLFVWDDVLIVPGHRNLLMCINFSDRFPLEYV